MKILTKKKQLEINKRVAAIIYITNHLTVPTDDDIKSTSKIIEILADISFDVGGVPGMVETQDLVDELYSIMENNKEIVKFLNDKC